MSTGPINSAVDVVAARERGITVCGTGYDPSPVVEHTWALILGAARNLIVEANSVRAGGWQVSVGTGAARQDSRGSGSGSLVARIGQASGMNTIAWSQNLTPERASEHVNADIAAVVTA